MRNARIMALLVALCLSLASVASASSTAQAVSASGKASVAHSVSPANYVCIYCGNAFYYGTVEGYTIGFYAWSVTDSFTVTTTAYATDVGIATWQFPGDFMTSVNWSIGTSPFSGDVSSGVSGTTDSYAFTNAYGYDIYTDYFGVSSPWMSPGTYWLTLSNATTYYDTTSYWDQNSGPSTAYQAGYGYLYQRPSEAFYIAGYQTPEPASLMLLGTGLLGLGGVIRRRLGR